MAQTVKKKKTYTGRNIRISETGFEEIKKFVDTKGLKLGRFAEDTMLKEIKLQSK